MLILRVSPPARPLEAIPVTASSHEAWQQLTVQVSEECMHRHAFPLCIGHLALFQCHRAIYISKMGDQEGPLCAQFLTPEIIRFISPSTEISALVWPPCLSRPQQTGLGGQSSRKRDLWSLM